MVNLLDEANPEYAIIYDEETHQRDTSYVPDGMNGWCGQCHNRYIAGPGAAQTATHDAVFQYRHPNTMLEAGCLSCHVAHGTSATMGYYSGSVPMPDGTRGGGETDSRLLPVDNRGICGSCHRFDQLS
jgi:hypothetical protein